MNSKVRTPLFLFLFANITFLILSVVALSLCFILVSLKYNNWGWFARSGSLIIIIGSLLAFRGTIRLTREEREERRNMTIIQQFTQLEKEDQERDSRAVIIGAIIMIFGTLIWAYGDLVNYFFI